jgi:hypothetical protein
MDEKRADVLADLAELALSAAPGTLQGQRPAVRVTVALSTLFGLDHQPADLDGHGPIPAGLARAIAADPTGTWRRLVTDDFGQLLDYGRTTYRPPANLRDHVVALYGRCTFPGCRRDARRAELDHVVPYPAGPTSAGNLHPACARHHHARHEGGWQVAKSPDHGVVWTSPSGRSYLTEPRQHPVDATAMDDPDPPPF